MNFSDGALAVLRRLEALRLLAYQDGAGVWTIGYGHTGPEVHAGLVWTRAQADAALARDVARFVAGVRTAVGSVALSDNQFGALVIFVFNIGLRAFGGSTALRRVSAGQFEQVPAALALWNKIRDPKTGALVVSPVLVKRRAAEVALWLSLDKEPSC